MLTFIPDIAPFISVPGVTISKDNILILISLNSSGAF